MFTASFIFATMKLNAAIFDMDGLLIDSEPLWKEAADTVLGGYGMELTHRQYAITTGLRTREFLGYWFRFFNIPEAELPAAEKNIIDLVTNLIEKKGKPMPGLHYILDFFHEQEFNIGLATSSPRELVDVVIGMLGLQNRFQAISSADKLAFGKPHPEVYLDCASKLSVPAIQCICFEDSFNGMIAAKAANMKCVIVPAAQTAKKGIWEAADLKISTLNNFNEHLLDRLQH